MSLKHKFVFVYLLAASVFALAVVISVFTCEVPLNRDVEKWDPFAIDLIKEMNKFMLSIGFLLFAGLGSLIINKKEFVPAEDTVAKHLLVITCLFVIFSIYFGYFLYNRMAEMLSGMTFDSSSPCLQLPQQFQFYFLLAAILVFSALVCRYLFITKKNTKEANQ